MAVKDGRIVEVGKIDGDTGRLRAKVYPSFIDLHNHSDFALLVERGAKSKTRMEVSTVVFPSRGSGVAPSTMR